MSGKAIGKKLNFGYAGSVARSADAVIVSYPLKGGPLPFGAPVVLNDDNTVSPPTDAKSEPVIGIAVRAVMQPKADAPDGWVYLDGDLVDVMTRGAISVAVKNAAVARPRDPLFVDLTDGQLLVDGGADDKQIPGAYLTTGMVDGNDIAEAVLTERLI